MEWMSLLLFVSVITVLLAGFPGAFSLSGTALLFALFGSATGTFDPAYLNYTLGKLMIRKLRDDWTATRGGRQAWRQFHDELLSIGGPPIPIIRKAMLGDNVHRWLVP